MAPEVAFTMKSFKGEDRERGDIVTGERCDLDPRGAFDIGQRIQLCLKCALFHTPSIGGAALGPRHSPMRHDKGAPDGRVTDFIRSNSAEKASPRAQSGDTEKRGSFCASRCSASGSHSGCQI